jgi:hypothetical protein
MESEENEDFQPESEKIAIYSKWAILGFSVFFSPVAGGILLMMNLRRIGKKAEGFLVLICGIVYNILVEIVLLKVLGMDIKKTAPQALLGNHQLIYYSLALYLLGGGVLAEIIFRRYFHADNYESRSIAVPLLILIGISLLFIL